MPIVCGVAIEVLLLVGMVGPLMFSFKDGKLCRTEDNSLARFITKRSTVLAAILSFAVYCVVAFYYKREFATSFRWEIAAGLLVLVTLFDRACNIIPNKILFLPLVLAPLLILIDILLNPNLWRSSVGTYLIAALMGGGIFFISRFITHGGIGAGDIKLMFVLGLLLGVKGYINVLKPDCVFLTGGDAPRLLTFIEQHSPCVICHEPNLVHIGLNQVLNFSWS